MGVDQTVREHDIEVSDITPPVMGKNNVKSKLLGYTFASLVIVTYTIAVVSAQLSVSTTPVFQRSCMRYVSQALITLVTVIICRSGIKVRRKHLYMIFIIAVFDYVYNYSFYLAAAYLPVGNMEGIFTCLIILILGFYDICRRKCEAHQTVAGLVCSLGLLLLVQPWKIEEELKNVTVRQFAPCELFGKTKALSDLETEINRTFTTANTWFSDHWYTNELQNATITTSLYSFQNGSSIDVTTMGMLPDNTTVPTNSSDAMAKSTLSDIWIGYVLIVSATICMSVISICIAKMTSEMGYHPAVVSFWAALLNAIVSTILMLSLEKPNLPASTYCTLFIFLLAILSGCNAFFSHITLKYLLPSQVALILSLSMVVLFICQNTPLPGIQAGRGNAEEIAGAVVTFVGAVSSPIYQLTRSKSSDKSQDIYQIN